MSVDATPGFGQRARLASARRGGKRLTRLRFGPDQALYISNKGFGPPQPGEILRVSVPGVTPAALASGAR